MKALYTLENQLSPTPKGRNCCAFARNALNETRRLGSFRRCLRHPPSPGRPGSQKTRLKIIDEIRVGDDQNSQIVSVGVVSGQHCGKQVVAKFCDPVYFEDSQDDIDPVLHVGKTYACESAAYRRLSARGQQNSPEFYGTYPLELTVCPGIFRSVRLILLEHVHGVQMQTLQPSRPSQTYRKAIMK